MAIFVPKGFKLAGVHCGIKNDPQQPDLTLVVSHGPAVGAGVYTQNRVYAAPVELDRQRTPSSHIRVVVANSGVANSCTGEKGLADACEMARLAGEACGSEAERVLVLSTGVIGTYLPMDKIAAGIKLAAAKLAADQKALISAAEGIMTTDAVRKLTGRTLRLGADQIQIAGMAKGAGMIGPNMATMLAILITDATLDIETAQSSLKTCVDHTFNCISVEGHTSTNDSVLLLASGAVGGDPLVGKELASFNQALHSVCEELARAIPSDGEGSTHLIAIEVSGCSDDRSAQQVARTVANSPLVKTAVTGNDPNWGRIVSAAGYAGVAFNPNEVCLKMNGVLLYENGLPVSFDRRQVSQSMRDNHETLIQIQCGKGSGRAHHWTSDLTAEYVHFNAEYHT
jgi:glutamate N-acetyltransferase/amino-acid N-acetyltransferase